MWIYQMIRYVIGFLLCLGVTGGAEFGDLALMPAFLLGVVGLMLMGAPVFDGTMIRLSKKL
tara:strand:- start:3250 stop:3432 length:183 start_codon:yes stop_codon:yes gene_type:complete